MSQNSIQNTNNYNRQLICTPSIFAQNCLFYVKEIGVFSCKSNNCIIHEPKSSFLFLIVLRGSGVLNYKDKIYNLKAGCVVWLDCKCGYSYTSSDDLPLLISWIYCDSISMGGLFSFFCKKQEDILIHVKELQPFIDIHGDIERIAEEKKSDFEHNISLKIHEFINMMTDFSRETDGVSNIVSSISEKNALIKEYIEQNFNRKITLDDLSREFCVSKYYMLRSFKNQYGTTIINYLQSYRIQHAKKLLRFSNMQIEAIGRDCGIYDVSYFNKLFRSFEGMTAGQYRKKWKK